MHKETATR